MNYRDLLNDKEFGDDIVFAKFINYMRKALLHKKLDYEKHQNYLIKTEQYLTLEEWSRVPDKSKTKNELHRFNKKRLKEGLEKLTEKQKYVIVQHYFKNKSFVEIGKELNMKDEAVRQMKLRAINTLKRIMEEK